jgi:hypothetical protein
VRVVGAGGEGVKYADVYKVRIRSRILDSGRVYRYNVHPIYGPGEAVVPGVSGFAQDSPDLFLTFIFQSAPVHVRSPVAAPRCPRLERKRHAHARGTVEVPVRIARA